MSAPHAEAFDQPLCPRCSLAAAVVSGADALTCVACQRAWTPTLAELGQAQRADAAWDRLTAALSTPPTSAEVA